jgi:hypothetical protein
MSERANTHVLILGAGFAGLYTALHLDRLLPNDAPVEITSGPDAESVLEGAGDIPFPVLADPEGTVLQAYAALLPVPPEEKPVVFVIDRYGGPYAALGPSELDDPALRREIRRWLTFVEIQCPECGAPEWPEDL